MSHIWGLPKMEFMPFSELEEARSVALIYSEPAWSAVESLLDLTVAWRGEVVDATEEHWLAVGDDLVGDVIYAVGGGLATDCGKYLAASLSRPLVCLPTALSVDAFLTWASGVRRQGCVYYVETKPPDRLIIDFEVLRNAPASIRAAGICDVLSIATGSWDWQFAAEHERNPPGMAFTPYAYQIAQDILQGALDCAEAAGQGDPDGLKQLLDCLALEVQLCNQIGHSRPEEGSEHYFAYSVENAMGKGLPHGDLVGPGIVLIAALQGQETQPLTDALTACGIPLTNVPHDVIHSTLRDLPTYSRQHDLPYGIAHTLSEDDLAQLPALS